MISTISIDAPKMSFHISSPINEIILVKEVVISPSPSTTTALAASPPTTSSYLCPRCRCLNYNGIDDSLSLSIDNRP